MNKPLQNIINKFFEGNEGVYETRNGEWSIANGGYDLVAEIYHGREPVLDIINDIGGYEVKCFERNNIGYDAMSATVSVLDKQGINIVNKDEVKSFLKENKPKAKDDYSR